MNCSASNGLPPPKRRKIVDVECCPPDQMVPPPSDPRRYFKVGFDPRAHACILSHLNGIAVVCLAPSHPVLQRKLQIASVDFKVGPRGSEDLAEIEIKGKKKRGALAVHPGLVICAIVTTDGERHLARCGVKGSLMSVNHRLLEEPELAISDPLGAGHLAVLQLKGPGTSRLVGDDEYARMLASGELAAMSDYGTPRPAVVETSNVAEEVSEEVTKASLPIKETGPSE